MGLPVAVEKSTLKTNKICNKYKLLGVTVHLG